jgi:hypothetical protein
VLHKTCIEAGLWPLRSWPKVWPKFFKLLEIRDDNEKFPVEEWITSMSLQEEKLSFSFPRRLTGEIFLPSPSRNPSPLENAIFRGKFKLII